MPNQPPTVVVFSPCPILTVTVEGGEGEPDALHLHAGGQGMWVARMAATLGANTVLCCSVGGETGQVMDVLMQQAGIRLAAGRSADASPAYIHDRRGGERDPLARTPGPTLSRHEIDELYNIALAEGLSADVVVLTGQNGFETVPADLYRRLSHDLEANGIRTVADVSGEDLAAIERVNVLKIAHTALIEQGDAASDNEGELIVALRDLAEHKADNVVVSRAEQPALAAFDGKVYEVKAPEFEASDHRGAGDSMTAALAVAFARGDGPKESLQLAAAAGAANVTRKGLGSGHRESIEKIAKAVKVRELQL